MKNRSLRGVFGDVFRRVFGNNGGQGDLHCGGPDKPRKRLLKGKQMFVDKVIEKKVFVTGKSERGRISGVPTAWRRIAVRYGLLGRSEVT